MKNNFDTSTAGVDLELSCFADIGVSQDNFSDNFERINNSDTKFYFINYGQSPEFEGFYIISNKRKFVNALFNFDGVYLKDIYTKKELLSWSGDELIREFEDDYDIEDFDGVKERYDCITATGYSQSDYIEVYVPKGNTWLTSEIVENLAFNAPIYCRLEIGSDEYYLSEGLESEYIWNRDEVLNYVEKTVEHEKKDYIITWLEENLPEEPEYQ